MADDGLVLIIAAALDIALTRGAKRHMWVRIVNGILGLLFFAPLGAAIYVTFKYS